MIIVKHEALALGLTKLHAMSLMQSDNDLIDHALAVAHVTSNDQ
jgi:hypothetical protein